MFGGILNTLLDQTDLNVILGETLSLSRKKEKIDKLIKNSNHYLTPYYSPMRNHMWDKVFKSGLSKFFWTSSTKFTYSTLDYFVSYSRSIIMTLEQCV